MVDPTKNVANECVSQNIPASIYRLCDVYKLTPKELIFPGVINSVYLVENNDGQDLALKVDQLYDPRENDLLSEAYITHRIRLAGGYLPKIVSFSGEDKNNDFPAFLLMQYLGEECLAGRTASSIDELLTWSSDLSHTIKISHDENIVLHDIKRRNIMRHQDKVHVIDAGAARIDPSFLRRNKSKYSVQVTPGYAAPEILGVCPKESFYAGDVFSLGNVFFRFLSGGAPYGGRLTRAQVEGFVRTGIDPNQRRLVNYIDNLHSDSRRPIPENLFGEEVPSPYVGLLDAMLQIKPSKRPSMNEVFQTITSLKTDHQKNTNAKTNPNQTIYNNQKDADAPTDVHQIQPTIRMSSSGYVLPLN
jgi:serine/threonine protein kinase